MFKIKLLNGASFIAIATCDTNQISPINNVAFYFINQINNSNQNNMQQYEFNRKNHQVELEEFQKIINGNYFIKRKIEAGDLVLNNLKDI